MNVTLIVLIVALLWVVAVGAFFIEKTYKKRQIRKMNEAWEDIKKQSRDRLRR